MQYMSLRAYARLRNISISSLQDRIKRGTITERCIDRTKPKRPLICAELADEDFAQRASPEAVALVALRQRVANEKTSAPPTPDKSVLQKTLPPLPKTEVVKEEIDGEEIDVKKIPYAGEDNFDRFRKAKAGSEELKGRKLELEVAEMEGRLIDKDEVKKQIQKSATLVRENLLNIPGKIAPELIAIKDLVEMESRLYAEINQALGNLSGLLIELGSD